MVTDKNLYPGFPELRMGECAIYMACYLKKKKKKFARCPKFLDFKVGKKCEIYVTSQRVFKSCL